MKPGRDARAQDGRPPGKAGPGRKRFLDWEADHRIRNSLQLVASLLSTEAREVGNTDAAACLKDAAARINAIARLHDSLSSASGEAVELTSYLEAICADVRVASGCDRRGVDLHVQGDAVWLASERALLIGLIVNELTTNAIKYAYPDGGGAVRVRVESEDAFAHYVVTVEDDGPGLVPGATSPDRLHGLQIIDRLASRLGGLLRVGSPRREHGLTVEVLVPRRAAGGR